MEEAMIVALVNYVGEHGISLQLCHVALRATHNNLPDAADWLMLLQQRSVALHTTGFPLPLCHEALAAVNNDMNAAVTWAINKTKPAPAPPGAVAYLSSQLELMGFSHPELNHSALAASNPPYDLQAAVHWLVTSVAPGEQGGARAAPEEEVSYRSARTVGFGGEGSEAQEECVFRGAFRSPASAKPEAPPSVDPLMFRRMVELVLAAILMARPEVAGAAAMALEETPAWGVVEARR